MATFRSPKYKSLVVKFSNRDRVKFENGAVDLDGDLAERLLDFADRHPEYEISAEGDVKPEPKPEPEPEPDEDDEADDEDDESDEDPFGILGKA